MWSRLLAIIFVLAVAKPALAADKPNIIIILADDMGYGDAHCYNSESKIPTPHLDQLAADGMRFTDAHTPSAVCTPTRYGLLTGRYCWRSRLKSGVLGGWSAPLIEDGRATIASHLQEQGYTTGIVGKWHLGLGWVTRGDVEVPKFWSNLKTEQVDFTAPLTDGPHTRGFDYSYIVPASLDMAPYVYIENGKVTQQPTAQQNAMKFPDFVRSGPRAPDLHIDQVLDDLTKRAVGFIERQAKQDNPFLLYFPLTAPHKPCTPHQRFRGKTAFGPYGDFVHQVDWTIGQVTGAIAKAGVRDNTLIVYTSDNGSFMYQFGPNAKDHTDEVTRHGYRAESHRANGPLRGTKADVWEAGHRVPFIARWPTRIQAGTTSNETICLTDLYATAAAICGSTLANDEAEDSFSLLPVFDGEPDQFERAPVINHSANGTFAIREGNWKLVLGNGSGGRQQPRGKPFERPYHLFNLEADLAETTNLIDEHPDIARRLEEACLQIRDTGRSRP